MSAQSSPFVVGIDASTTAVKAVVYSATGRSVAVGRRSLPMAMPHPGWHEQDPRDWWSATLAALGDATGQVDRTRIGAIGVTHQRESFACLDDAGDPIRPALLWVDGRAGAEIADYGTETVHALSGKPPDVTPALYKLAWLRRHEPETLTRSHRVVDTGGYLLWRFTDRYATSVASADPLGLLDMHTRRWAPELLEIAGLDAGQLPELVAPGEIVEKLHPRLADELGLPAGIPVVAGAGDGQCAGLGAAVTGPGPAYLNLGTAMATGIHLADYGWGRQFRTLINPLPTAYTGEMLLSSCTYLVRWLEEKFGGGSDDGVPDAETARAAAAVPPGSDGLLTLPYWNSAQTPYWDPLARGAVVGWRGSHGRPHLYRSILESTALELRLQMDGLESWHDGEAGPITEFRAMGGGSRSDLWLQIVADVTRRPVQVCAEEEVSALGAAMLAAAAIGLHGEADIGAVGAAMASFTGVVEPHDADEVYEPLYAAYRRLYPQLAEIFPLLERATSTAKGTA